MLKKLLLLPLLLCLLSCESEQTGAGNNKNELVIRFGITSAPVTLDPLYATDATSSRINRLLYETLIQFSDNDLPVPGIASWHKFNDRHYRFTLIKQSFFHHGKQLTTRDVKATYEALLDPGTASPHRNALKHIERIEVIDDKTIDFHLSRSDPIFPAFLVIEIMPEDLLDADHPFNQQPVGSGAFEFSHWPFEGQLYLRRRDDQQLFELLTVKDPTVRVLKLLKGELDLIQNNLPPEHINYLKKQNNVQSVSMGGSNYTYLGFNLQDSLTGQALLRQAIAHALDRKRIIKFALGNAARSANGFFPPEHWVGLETQGLSYDLKKARAIMQKLGYSEVRRLKLTYKTSSDPFRIRIATIIQSQLKSIFIDVDIRSYDWGTFYGDIKQGKFQLYSLSWVGIKTPDIFRYVFHSESLPPAGANRGRLHDNKLDRLIEKAEQMSDLKIQADTYRKIQQRINTILPYVSLWYEDNIAFYRHNISGYRLSTDGNYDGLTLVKKSAENPSE